MMHTNFRRALVAAMAFSIAACGDSPVAPDANLSQAQVEEMMDAMSAIGAFTFFPGGASMQSAMAQVASVTSPINETSDCPNGGTVSTSGSMNINENTGNFSAQLSNDYSNCKATSSTGRVWTFNGDPSVSNNMTLTFNEATGGYSFSGSQDGGLRFSSNEASGRCSINLSYTMTTTAEGVATGSVTGTVCGQSVDQAL